MVETPARSHLLPILSLVLFLGTSVRSEASVDRAPPWHSGELRVSATGRSLEHRDGAPFLWIGDTAWELCYKLTSDSPGGHDIDTYFETRVAQGFTVIQTVLVDEIVYKTGMGCAENGSTPFLGFDPEQPVEAYWAWVDQVISRAEDFGLYLCLLPCWGNWVNNEAIFNPSNAYTYGRFLGERYKDRPNVIWMLGGDRPVSLAQKEIWNRMAQGIKEVVKERQLMTFHPAGATSSSSVFHDEAWLDFNTYQSGHSRDESNVHLLAAQDWNRSPVKPTLNGEPGYEGIVERFWEDCGNPRFTAYDVRKDAYRSVLSGSFGYTYGHSSVWQMFRKGDPRVACVDVDLPWYDALDSAGASHMRFVGRLLKSRPADRWPEETLVSGGLGAGETRMAASRGADFALVYFPDPSPRVIQLGRINGGTIGGFWYNPRNGVSLPLGVFENSGEKSFTPPGSLDWVLVLDDADSRFAEPGTKDIWHARIIE